MLKTISSGETIHLHDWTWERGLDGPTGYWTCVDCGARTKAVADLLPCLGCGRPVVQGDYCGKCPPSGNVQRGA